jgi:uncharacterized membrane protein
MDSSRLEAFSVGVMAVIITRMVLGLKAPAGASLHDLRTLLPNFLICPKLPDDWRVLEQPPPFT